MRQLGIVVAQAFAVLSEFLKVEAKES